MSDLTTSPIPRSECHQHGRTAFNPARYVRPFWTSSIPDLIREANEYFGAKQAWTVLQLGWIWHQENDMYGGFAPTWERRLFPAFSLWGAQAYVVSRHGMEAMIDRFFSDRTAESMVRLLEGVGVVEFYFESLGNETMLVALPSLFTVDGTTSTVEPSNPYRRELHRESNNRHIQATLQLYYSGGTKT